MWQKNCQLAVNVNWHDSSSWTFKLQIKVYWKWKWDSINKKTVLQSQCYIENKKAVLSQRRPHDALYILLPWKFWRVPDYAHAPLSPKFLWPFVWSEPANVPAKFEVHSFKRSWDNWEHRINLGSPCICPCSVFSIIFKWFCLPLGYEERRCWANCPCN